MPTEPGNRTVDLFYQIASDYLPEESGPHPDDHQELHRRLPLWNHT